jgi:quercetin 2,3-dioxygenase
MAQGQASLHYGSLRNPAHLPLGNLIVFLDAEISPGPGFGPHSHRNLEIITCVREGTILHSDTIDGVVYINAGEIQAMSTGAGIRHGGGSDAALPSHVFQIWMLPREPGGKPYYSRKPFRQSESTGRFVVLASGFEEDTDALPLRADARILGAAMHPGQAIVYELPDDRFAYLVPSRGDIRLNGMLVHERDGVAISKEHELRIEALSEVELVLVDSTPGESADQLSSNALN